MKTGEDMKAEGRKRGDGAHPTLKLRRAFRRRTAERKRADPKYTKENGWEYLGDQAAKRRRIFYGDGFGVSEQ
jgi:hypothetical protein